MKKIQCSAPNTMPIPDEAVNLRGYSGVDKDLTESTMTKQSLEEQLKFEMLADILGRVTNLTSDEVDREIEDAQRRVCEYLGLDLSALWQFTAESPPTLTMTHVYRSLEGPPIPETMDARQSFPWCMDEIMAGRIISVADVEKTPPEAEHDREEWRHFGIKSALTFPLSLGGRPAIGALNFCSIREQYEWPDTLVKHLHLIAQVFSNVIARKRWEEAIMKSEAKYRGLHEGMMDGFVMANHDGMIIEHNDTYLKMTGYNPEELLRLTYRDLTPERWHDFEQEIVEQQVLVRGYSEIYEKEYRKKDGTVFPVELRTFLSKAETGNKAGMWAIIRDISDRKRIQVALYESKERFRHVAESVADFIWEIDTDGLYQYVSPSIEGILGYQPDELIGKVCFYDLFAEEVREELKGAAFEVFAAKERFRAFPNSNISKDGRVVHLETSGAPVLDKAGNLVGYRGADTDVTYRKQMEEKIQMAAQDWQTVFDSIPDVVMMLDRDYRVIRANAATNSFLGLSMEDIVGHYCYTLMHGMEKPDEDDLFAEMRKSKRHAEKELYDETRHAWFRISVDPGFDDKGEIRQVVHTVKDITGQKEKDIESFTARSFLQRTDRLLQMGELTASLAHELNQPLTSILSNAQAALRFIDSGTLNQAELIEILRDIVNDDKRAGNIIRSLRSMVKPQENEREVTVINNIAREAIALFHSEAIIRRIKVETVLENALPSVNVDKVQIQQVIINLMMNAADSMLDVSTIKKIIIQTAAASDGGVLVTVSDSGTGIAEEKLAKIFEPFFTTKFSGLGMGLSLSRSIIESHGGHIWAEQNTDGGATFFFDLPGASAK